MAWQKYAGFVVGIVGAIVGAVVGGVVGFYGGGYPGAVAGAGYGAFYGFQIGALVGGVGTAVFFPERSNLHLPPPPQPHETRLQFSSWGMAIPIQYGSGRMAGNIIYMSDITETITRSKHRQDGVRYYEMVRTYTATFAIAFCEAPATGWVNRIWVNNKVFVDYNGDSVGIVDPGIPLYGGLTGNVAISISRSLGSFNIHMGYETQTHDSSIAAIIGAAETPAYRGICYITFVNFPIGEFSGVPNIEIEILDSDSIGWWCTDDFDGINGYRPNPSCWVIYPIPKGIAFIDDNKLKLISAPYEAGVLIRSVSTRIGDIDAQIDYSDVSMPSSGSFTILLTNTVDHTSHIGSNIGYFLEAWPGYYRWTYAFNGTYTYADYTPGPASYGKMRITRVINPATPTVSEIKLYMKNTTDVSWNLVHTFSNATIDPMFFSFQIWNRSASTKVNTESVKFDNFLSL